jgi:hypothetical protein
MAGMGVSSWPPGIPNTTYDRLTERAADGPPQPSPPDARRRKVALVAVVAAFIGVPAVWFWWSLGNGNPRSLVASFEVGQCIDEWREADGSWHSRPSDTVVKPVECNVEHDGEIVGRPLFVRAGSGAPSYGEMAAFADPECRRQVDAYAGNTAAALGLSVTFAYPVNQAWSAGDHSIVCIAGFAKASLFESVRGSPR